jgi:alpha-beta hydrolase superfamily lysophospholipase
VRTYETSWKDPQAFKFLLRCWEPDERAKAVVVLVHGLGEHSGRYSPVAEHLTRAGYAMLGFDLRGHGLSDGPRGHTPSYMALLDDISGVLGQIQGRYPGFPVFLYGHSLGGGLALNFVIQRMPKLQGVIVTSPWLRLASELPPFQAALARIINQFAPGFRQKWGLDTKALSHDVTVADKYEHDPLVHNDVSVRMYVSCSAAGRWALEHSARFPLPLLLMHGTADRVTSYEASREFVMHAGKNVTWRAWEGGYHELHNEPGRSTVLRVVIRWMNARLLKKRLGRAVLDRSTRA